MPFPDKPKYICLLSGAVFEKFDKTLNWDNILPNRRVFHKRRVLHEGAGKWKSLLISIDNYGNFTLEHGDVSIYCLESFTQCELTVEDFNATLDAMPQRLHRDLLEEIEDEMIPQSELRQFLELFPHIVTFKKSKGWRILKALSDRFKSPPETGTTESKIKMLKRACLEVMADVRCPQVAREKLHECSLQFSDVDFMRMIVQMKEALEVHKTIADILHTRISELGEGKDGTPQMEKLQQAVRGNDRHLESQLLKFIA